MLSLDLPSPSVEPGQVTLISLCLRFLSGKVPMRKCVLRGLNDLILFKNVSPWHQHLNVRGRVLPSSLLPLACLPTSLPSSQVNRKCI